MDFGWLEPQIYFDRQGNPISREEGAQLLAHSNRAVARDILGTVTVSTVFLVLNHQFDRSQPPLIFETMIFGGEHDECQWRWPTEETALEGHRRVVAWLRGEGEAP